MHLTPENENYITFCTLVKSEDDYLDEWISFHLASGVQKFLIIENGKKPPVPRVLRGYISAGIVTFKYVPASKNAQREAFNRAISYLKNKTRWVGFFDVDEFVFSPRGQSLPEVLKQFEDYPGVAVNWVSYGSGGHQERPRGWVTESFLERGPINHKVPVSNYEYQHKGGEVRFRAMNTHVKCFVDPAQTLHFRTAHSFKFKGGRLAVTEEFEPIDGPFSERVSVRKLRVNHYWSKSISELQGKVQKGRVSQQKKGRETGYSWELATLRESLSNGVMDDSALALVPKARALSNQFRLSLPTGNYPIQTSRLRYSAVDWLQQLSQHASRFVRKIAKGIKGLVFGDPSLAVTDT
jgi:hypothetical protein